MKYKLLCFLLIILIVSCGKKTDPIPKSQFIHPEEDTVVLEVTEKGIIITNNDNKYNLIVYRSLCENCGNNFKQIVVIEPKESYIDKEVVEKTPYFYKFIFKHSEYNVFSEPFIKRITFAQPISVKNLQIIPLGSNKIKINTSFTNTLHHYKLFLNNELYYEGRDPVVEVNLTKGSNNISILPFDIYNNKGKLYTRKIDTYNLLKPAPVRSLNYVISGEYIYISWDKSENANKYTIKIRINNSVNEYNTKLNYYRFKFPSALQCIDIEVTAENDYMSSESRKVRACKRQ
jgi:hypothetical protein